MSQTMVGSRTDLALEVRESFPEDHVEIQGVLLKEDYNKEEEIKITTVQIRDEAGKKAMRKPIGTYITIEAKNLDNQDEEYFKPLSREVAKYIKHLTKGIENKKILVAGLGNKDVTPDALGPGVVDNLFVTRHLIKEFGEEFKNRNHMENLSAISPGVMGQTGMETSEILRGIIQETKPDLLIVVDALASRSVNRLNSTIQITDTGISPGSGVGNNRAALNKETLGIDVIAIGVPTVVDAATIVTDSMEQFLMDKDFTENEIQSFLSEIQNEETKNMFVTPKNIDESIKKLSYTISEALNSCFFSAVMQ